MLNKDLLSIIVCPKCKGDVKLNKAENAFLCTSCCLAYEVKNDIPIMLIEKAKKI